METLMNHADQRRAAPISVAARPDYASDRLVGAAMAGSCLLLMTGWLGFLGWGAGRLFAVW
ncbi:hypothetical protein GCM10007036_18390 [Alsobacter metallidurans]|uniref:Uncharacterized protein n=2 Tax=Alsobacter metallidurans TaxID=340221 RepID=A0A917I6D2_9HYPH|nr:hypothetical protein GCM10007036_18390 [Alsobacter metallidurans]